MNQKEIKELLQIAKENSPKRNFKQAIELIITLKGIDVKKTDGQIDFYTNTHYDLGKKIKVCAFVGPELADQAKEDCDNVVLLDDFGKYSDKKIAKKLANDYDYFIAQATIMGKIASAFGKILGPRSKMPDPKAGCVVPPNANLKQLMTRLQTLVRITAKTAPHIQIKIGREDMDEAHLIDNILTIYNQVVHHLPQEKNNIRDVFLKLTMGKPAKLGFKDEQVKDTANKKGAEKEKKKGKAEKKTEKEEKKTENAEEKEIEKVEEKKEDNPEKENKD